MYKNIVFYFWEGKFMWYTKELNRVFNELNTRKSGLTEEEASKRLELLF